MCYRGHNYEGDHEQEVCVIGDIIMRVNKKYVL